MQGQLDSVAKELKEEKLESKRLKSELVRTQDELAEVKMEKESADMVIIIHPPLSIIHRFDSFFTYVFPCNYIRNYLESKRKCWKRSRNGRKKWKS